ncbi:hypothetical protein BKA61DRAFT_673641 [Leptodontidium sp. MPI-SDFR-AT-0119]|nr:hypothetical protein BKA61DRAFT_673641 [Leptodontidium sp. MPI-SDFR-AT-0119]
MSSSTGTPSATTFKPTRGSSSSLEPSPASTFGGSASSNAGDDDCPQTPGDDGVLLSKLSKLFVNDGKATSRYSPPFVRNGSQSKVEDPFTSPQHRSGQRTPIGPKPKGRSPISDNWRSGSSSGSGSGRTSPAAARIISSAQSGHGVFVQEYSSEDGELTTNEQVLIKPEDAQAIFPPSSCVFVANLLQSEGDEALEVAVTQIFREFGTVYVKIRRDAKHMPFAFCQYTNDADAERAIKEGRGRLVKGRPCRCEKAKAHRLFFFERKYGPVVTPSEVQQLLRSFGRISFCRHINDVERAAYNLNEGVMVQFEMYDEGQAAQQAFRNHTEFKMQCMANMASPARQGFNKSDPAHRSYLDTYEVDKRSVFVGNLSIDVNEAELYEIFQHFGNIVQVTLHKNDSTVDVSQKHCFAFVEFQQQPSVPRALVAMSGYVLRDRTIRVSQKDTEGAKARTRRQPARLTPASTGPYQSPAARSADQHQASPMAYMSPGYGSPYGFAQGGQYYNYQGASLPGQVQYYSPTAYSPSVFPASYFTYTGSPTYNAGVTSAATITGSPSHAQYYYGGYPQYPSPASYWPTSSPVAAAQQPVNYYMQAYSPPTTDPVQEDRSATPTPAGHPSTTDTSLESE